MNTAARILADVGFVILRNTFTARQLVELHARGRNTRPRKGAKFTKIDTLFQSVVTELGVNQGVLEKTQKAEVEPCQRGIILSEFAASTQFTDYQNEWPRMVTIVSGSRELKLNRGFLKRAHCFDLRSNDTIVFGTSPEQLQYVGIALQNTTPQLRDNPAITMQYTYSFPNTYPALESAL